MVSITDVPIKDIILFLKNNKIKLSVNDKDNYDKALNLVIKGKGINYPDSLIDWIIAYNLSNEGKHIRIYTRGEIDLMNDKELLDLANFLEIYEINNLKQSIINVLKYLKKLAIGIVHPDIDLNILQTLRALSEKEILSSNYEDIIKIFQKNKSLRKFIYDNIATIIMNNTSDNDYFSGSEIVKLAHFIIDLMKMKEITLTKEVLRVARYLIKDHDNRTDFMSYLYNYILIISNTNLIENYFKLLPYLRDLYPGEALDDDLIIITFEEDIDYDSTENYRDYVIPFYTAAIRVKNKPIINYLIYMWGEGGKEAQKFKGPADKPFIDEMKTLVKEAELVVF